MRFEDVNNEQLIEELVKMARISDDIRARHYTGVIRNIETAKKQIEDGEAPETVLASLREALQMARSVMDILDKLSRKPE